MERKYVEKERTLPIKGESDILIVGGGIAGIAAALAARREGKSVRILEKSCVLGGLATAGHVCVYLPLCDGLGHKIYGGLAEELLYTTIKYGYNTLPKEWNYGAKYVENPSGRYQTHFNIPACVLAFDELMQENNIDVVFDTLFCDTVMEEDKCRGVIAENKSGRCIYEAKVIIDASGDADVMYRAGAACTTAKSIVSHWAYELDFDSIKKGLKTGEIKNAFALRWIGLRPDADNSKSEIPRFYGTESEGVNKYIRLSRQLALDFLKKKQSNDYTMLTLPYMPQFRTTRHIDGVKAFEPAAGVNLEDSVGCMINCLDDPAEVFEFPYGAMIDKNVSNMLAAGRIVAADGIAWEITRYIPGCAFTGQAAGIAASMAAERDIRVQDVPVSELQDKLAATGVLIHIPEEVKQNKGEAAYKDPKKQFDPMIRIDSLEYNAGH